MEERAQKGREEADEVTQVAGAHFHRDYMNRLERAIDTQEAFVVHIP